MENTRHHINTCLLLKRLRMHIVSDVAASETVKLFHLYTWGVHVLRYPNFFLGEWKQIET